MTPTRPLIPELARMVSEGRIEFLCDPDHCDAYLGNEGGGGEGDFLLEVGDGWVRLLAWRDGHSYAVPGISTQHQAAAWIASRVGGAGGEEKGLP